MTFPVNAEIGPGRRGQVRRKRDIDRHGSAADRRIDAHDPPLNRVRAGVDHRGLSHGDILRLRLRYADFGFQAARNDDPRQRLPRLHPLSFLKRNVERRQHAAHRRGHMHGLDAILAEPDQVGQARDLFLLGADLLLRRAHDHVQALLLGLEAKPKGFHRLA